MRSSRSERMTQPLVAPANDLSPAAYPHALPANAAPRRILIVKVSSLGDVVHNMPLVHDLRARWPACEIDWVVEEGYVDLVRLLPEVSHVIPFALRRWRKRFYRRDTWHELGALRDAIRARPYDAVLETQGLLKTAVVARTAARVAGAPVIGLGNATQGSGYEPAARLFYTAPIQVPRQTHSVRRSRLLGAALTAVAPPEPPKFLVSARARCMSMMRCGPICPRAMRSAFMQRPARRSAGRSLTGMHWATGSRRKG